MEKVEGSNLGFHLEGRKEVSGILVRPVEVWAGMFGTFCYWSKRPFIIYSFIFYILNELSHKSELTCDISASAVYDQIYFLWLQRYINDLHKCSLRLTPGLTWPK